MAWADFPDARHSVSLLQRSLERGRLAHAYLFSGESHDLLERVARELATTVNCTGSSSTPAGALPSTACGHCSSCRRIAASLHPDVHWIRAESKTRIIRVDQVRELISTIQLKPTEGRRKVGVLVGADRLQSQSANAFLKTLEEPPSGSLLLLLSTEPERLLETILSRCLRLTFPGAPTPDPEHLEWLNRFAATLEAPPRSLLARYLLLDSLLVRLGRLREIAEEEVERRSPAANYKDVDPALREQWEEEAEAAVEAEYRRRRAAVLQDVQRWLRDLWLITLDQPTSLLAFPHLEAASRAVARRLDPPQAMANLEVIERTQTLLHTNVQEALALEIALIKLRL
ncbi:MAG: hypothetical protein IT580_10915 [Verrucomicrobiales bacterium]|nr:hypothetical protein [Verrucomicrobiales bacterium]